MNKAVIEEAAGILSSGGTLLYPTDTVWGLGCDATSTTAVEKIFDLKHRPREKSLVILVSSEMMLEQYVEEVPAMAWQLVSIADQPLTIIYPRGKNLAANTLAADGSVGIRLVTSGFCHELIRKFRKPIVSTSANLSGERTPASFGEISPGLISRVDWVAPPDTAAGMTLKPSSIIKLSLNGEISIIRK